MDQYPDEEEEFELRYQEELEMLDELPPEREALFAPSTSNNSSKIINSVNRIDTIDSPQLSQISTGMGTSSVSGVVNRRLFGTPKGPHERISSTPLAKDKQRETLAPIEEVVNLTPLPECEPLEEYNELAVEYQGVGLRNKRRLERDLFGDIDDLYQNETYEDPIAKKARTEEERDLELIAKILETRRRLQECNKAVRQDDLSRLRALHDFKMRNLSYTVPQWPFQVIQRGEHDRIFVRFHSEEYETRALEDVRALPQYDGLLGENKQRIWAEANEIVLKRTTTPSQQQLQEAQPQAASAGASSSASSEGQSNQDEKLWVEKYKPRKYIDLLSDEATNRSLLYWLKMWDKVVFGREFKKKDEHNANSSGGSNLNTFNKRTGKFETNGGWRKKKFQQLLDTNLDEHGRPMQKVALLCGPPGLGKTTLAHTIARHAGYEVREINASDDRSPEAFKQALENGTQMSSVLNENRRPNCIVLDEIDGAPRQSIEFLVKFVSDNLVNKAKAKGKTKPERNILKRPIICICNDIYEPALRPLRQIAFVVTFPPIETTRLTERLLQIAQRERMKTDFSALYAMSEKSGNDVRCCISTLQFFNAQKKALALQDVLNANLGQKDRQQGLFDVWGAVFRIQRPRKQLGKSEQNDNAEDIQITMTDMSTSTRVRNVLEVVHGGGDYERLTQGVFENYLHQKMPDPNLTAVVEATKWFSFTDAVQHQINHLQNYTVYPYLQFGFVVWHLLFATLAWPKINFPTKGFEFRQKSTTQSNIFQAFRKGISTGMNGLGQGHAILMDTVPLLKRILSPQFRSVAVQLLSQRERGDLYHTVTVMADLGLTYTQVKSAEGSYVFQMEPDLDALAQFPGYPGISLNYFSRQLVAREVELERIRRSTPRLGTETSSKPRSANAAAPAAAGKDVVKKLPNHLQRLKAKQIDTKNANAKKDVISKDFFGRIQHKTVGGGREDCKTDAIVKSPIWYRYKEGFNNAVRKDIQMNELL
ncbi:chromosome transmission fidelity protein 18 homolog [Anastrepha ludens]|uniref:chromosome transmission fidelity protein 18 homolog n=1 Tax=Anastrepha ludens TaxID=28586 RepID=UPI0023AEE4DA|nr:chromosome transmission fidelity protein 18 homolog [Anastrepha ludens]